MEVLYRGSNSASISLLLVSPQLTTRQRCTHGNSCYASRPASSQATNEKLRCWNLKSAWHHCRWKLELGFKDLNITRIARTAPGWSLFRGGRRDSSSCCRKIGLRGGPDEPVEEAEDQTLPQDEHYSPLGNAVKEGEVPTSGMADDECERISTLPAPSAVYASTNKIDGLNSRVGILITAGHFLLAAGALVLVDSTILKATPPSGVQFVLTSPFMLSAAVTATLGYFFVPFLNYLKAAQIFRIEGPTAHLVKIGTPTMGGLFFIPVGVAVAGIFVGFNSIEVQGATAVTLAFAGIGLLDDGLAFQRRHNYGLPGRIKFILQASVGIILFYWLEFANMPSPYKIKHVVWLPAPFGLLELGKWYLPLTAFCCAAMSNGVNLTDGLDGLAGGTAAIAFIAMSVTVFRGSTVMPFALIGCVALGVFGSSMAGMCFGFLAHNRYKATVFMGDTGSLALGGALAAMACQSGMFFPLFIASGVFVIETVSVIGQVFYFKLTKKMYGKGRRWLRMSPFHHHLELIGLKEPVIIITAYSVSIATAVLAAFLVLGSS